MHSVLAVSGKMFLWWRQNVLDTSKKRMSVKTER